MSLETEPLSPYDHWETFLPLLPTELIHLICSFTMRHNITTDGEDRRPSRTTRIPWKMGVPHGTMTLFQAYRNETDSVPIRAGRPHGLHKRYGCWAGRFIYIGSYKRGLLHGLVQEFDSNAGYLTKSEYRKDGYRHGTSIEYNHLNGRKISSRMYKNGELNGPMIYYYHGQDGEKTRTLTNMMHNKRHGMQLTFYDDGKTVIEQTRWEHGQRHGWHKKFDPITGEVTHREWYLDGKPVKGMTSSLSES